MLIYQALNSDVVEIIPQGLNRMLDIGCGDGSLGAYLKSRSKLEVVGVTYSKEEADSAEKKLDKVIVADINTITLEDVGKFDVIVCSHILEHLYQPDLLILKLRNLLMENGILIIALPNILHWKQRWKFIRGSFQYTDGGLMDKTHFRFFDWQSSQELIVNNGYYIDSKKATGALPLPFLRRFLPGSVGRRIDRVACSLFPGLFGFQFVFVCKPIVK